MKTMERGHEVLPLNSAGRNLAHCLDGNQDRHNHWLERMTTAEVLVPLAIVLLTVVTVAVQYYLAAVHGHLIMPTFVDIPLA